MGLKLVTPPDGYPVSLDEAKLHLDVEFDDKDDRISLGIAAATQALEIHLGRVFMPQVWDYYLDTFPKWDRPIRLPLPPLISVESVNYIDPDTGNEVELSLSEYEVDTSSEFGWIATASSWPIVMSTINAVRVRFTAGYSYTEESPIGTTVPKPIRQAILIWVRDLYDNPGSFVVGVSVQAIPNAVERLTEPYRGGR